jgi:hypothetical protein
VAELLRQAAARGPAQVLQPGPARRREPAQALQPGPARRREPAQALQPGPAQRREAERLEERAAFAVHPPWLP